MGTFFKELFDTKCFHHVFGHQRAFVETDLAIGINEIFG